MAQSILSVRMDSNLKDKFDALCGEFGMNPSTAVTVFAKTVVRQRKIPFEIGVDEDPFWSKTNQRHLQKAVSEIKEKKYTIHDLIETDDSPMPDTLRR
jgi:DNA-damage-inducible protein J